MSKFRQPRGPGEGVCGPDMAGQLPSAASLLMLAPRMLAAGCYGALTVVRRTLDGGYSEKDAKHCERCLGRHAPGAKCCVVPDTACPDSCVCAICWAGCPGDSFNYQLQITNTGEKERDFTLEAVPFACTDEVVQVAPAAKTLASGESFRATVTFTVPGTFAGSDYEGVIRVRGAYEQIIKIKLAVQPVQFCCCHIEQGEVPLHTKAHHWFNHFQCEKPCFPALGE